MLFRRTNIVIEILQQLEMAEALQIKLSENVKVLKLTEVCDYTSKVNAKKFIKYWVILVSDLPGEGCLYFYHSKSSAQHGSAVFIEQIADMTDVSHFGYSKQQKILQLSYADHVLFLQFSSSATMQQWHSKLRKYLWSFPLCLYNSPQHPDRQDHYILQYHNNKLAVYLSLSNKHKWTWHITQLRRFSYDSKIPYTEIESGRSSETGEGNFYFTGNKVFKLYQLLVSLSMKARPGISDPKPSKSLDVPDLDDEYVYMDQSSSDEMSTRSSKTIGGRSGRISLPTLHVNDKSAGKEHSKSVTLIPKFASLFSPRDKSARDQPIASSSKKSMASSAPHQSDFLCKDKGHSKASPSTPNVQYVLSSPSSPAEDVFELENEDYFKY
ncbi:uncharacterized protein [Dysidea avara]|uniref:uncharacterized protein n=1 Tax=Dysidea avara TaxID=196820 RepID=UPI0033175C7E